MYLANYTAEKFPNIEVYWIAKSTTDISQLSDKISVISMDSEASYKLLSDAGVAIVGQNFYDLSSTGYKYVQGACTILLWHGVPWKRIGFDAARSMNFL